MYSGAIWAKISMTGIFEDLEFQLRRVYLKLPFLRNIKACCRASTYQGIHDSYPDFRRLRADGSRLRALHLGG